MTILSVSRIRGDASSAMYTAAASPSGTATIIPMVVVASVPTMSARAP